MLACDGSVVSGLDLLADRTRRVGGRLTLLRDTAGCCGCGWGPDLSATTLGTLTRGCVTWLVTGPFMERRSKSRTPRKSATTMAAPTATYAPTSKNRLSRMAIGVKRCAISGCTG